MISGVVSWLVARRLARRGASPVSTRSAQAAPRAGPGAGTLQGGGGDKATEGRRGLHISLLFVRESDAHITYEDKRAYQS